MVLFSHQRTILVYEFIHSGFLLLLLSLHIHIAEKQKKVKRLFFFNLIWYVDHSSGIFFTAWLAVSCALFPWCCLRGYPGEEEPVRGKIRVSNSVIARLNNFNISFNSWTYFIVVHQAHFCHIYGEVMLVGHDYLYFIHLEDNACGLIFNFTLFYWMFPK